jgi:hypothetical protein
MDESSPWGVFVIMNEWDCINSKSFLDQLSGISCSKGRRGVDVVLGNQFT